MGRFYRIIFCSFILSIIIVCGILTTNAQQRLNHPGRVVDMVTGRPLEVDIKAWPESRQTAEEGDCPLYGNSPLDSTRSDIGQNGAFQLEIDATKPTYTTTYCSNEYYPRADRDLRNNKDGHPVEPVPVQILKRDTEKSAYAFLIRNKTISLLSDLSYLERNDPDTFATVMNSLAKDFVEFSPDRGEMLFKFRDFVHNWNR